MRDEIREGLGRGFTSLTGCGTQIETGKGHSPGAKLENGGLPYTESPLSFECFN